MFGIGPGEFFVIVVALLIVVGPRRLPEAARWLGRTMGEIQRAAETARREVESASAEIENVVGMTGSNLDPDDETAEALRAIAGARSTNDPFEPVKRDPRGEERKDA